MRWVYRQTDALSRVSGDDRVAVRISMSRNLDDTDHRARVLIVDDDSHNRQLLEVMLTPEGYIVLTAASGEEALAIVERNPPDLILLDVMMPGLDGYQVTTTI